MSNCIMTLPHREKAHNSEVCFSAGKTSEKDFFFFYGGNNIEVQLYS